MTEENNVGVNLIWALTTMIIIAIIAGAIFYSGVLKKSSVPDTDIDINIPAPAKSQ